MNHWHQELFWEEEVGSLFSQIWKVVFVILCVIYCICDVRNKWKRKRNTCHHADGSVTNVIGGGLALVSNQMPTQTLANHPYPTGRVENSMKNLMGQNKDREIA